MLRIKFTNGKEVTVNKKKLKEQDINTPQQVITQKILKMTTVGNTLNEMKSIGMQIPAERIIIQIQGARTILENCFKYFLSLQNEDFYWQPEYEEIVDWLENNEGKGLFLYGDCGRGKSLLSRYVLPAILLKYCRKVVRVYDVQEINSNIDEVLKKHILSLDDIGTEELSVNYGNKRLAFAEIMDAAEKYGKLIIISTNLKKQGHSKTRGIIDTYGERVFERIIATTKRVAFQGESLRK